MGVNIELKRRCKTSAGASLFNAEEGVLRTLSYIQGQRRLFTTYRIKNWTKWEQVSPRAFTDAQPRGRTAAHDRADEAPKSLKVEVRLNPEISSDKASVRISCSSSFWELGLQARVDRFAEPGQYAASNHLMAGESLLNVSHKVWLTRNARYACHVSWKWVTALIS